MTFSSVNSVYAEMVWTGVREDRHEGVDVPWKVYAPGRRSRQMSDEDKLLQKTKKREKQNSY